MSNILPAFTSDGVLPVGDYVLTIKELRQSHLVTGQMNASPGWDSEWRGHLVDNLAIMAEQLWAVGIPEIFVDGSLTPHVAQIPGGTVPLCARLSFGHQRSVWLRSGIPFGVPYLASIHP